MAKQLVHIGLAVATDGIMPVRNNILNIAAVCGDAYKFNENVYPQTGEYKESPFWTKHPAEFEALRVRPVMLADAMARLREWLKQFQGTLVACSTAIDYWHLLNAFFSTGKDCPFGTLPIDTGTLMMAKEGRRRPMACTDKAEPLAVAHARWVLATNGRMPQFGAQPRKRKLTLEGLGGELPTGPPRAAARLTEELRRVRDAEEYHRARRAAQGAGAQNAAMFTIDTATPAWAQPTNAWGAPAAPPPVFIREEREREEEEVDF